MIELEQLSYTYPDADRPVFREVTLGVTKGAFALVVGPSGAGKSTLLRCLNGLVPHFSGGHLAGRVVVAGLDPVAQGPQVMSRRVGFVFQDPETQFVMDQVEDEIAFALENAALPRDEMVARVDRVLELLDLQPLRDRALDTLSGGEKQRVAIAAALALRPQILVLDEPTSQLDPQSAADVLDALTRLNETLDLTVVLAEQRLERVLPYADSLVYLPGPAEPVIAGAPRSVLQQMAQVPPLVALGKALNWSPLPLTTADGRAIAGTLRVHPSRPVDRPDPEVSPVLAIHAVKVAYGQHVAVRDVDLTLHPGEIATLMGRNGSGKTTLLRAMVGLTQPRQGRITLDGEDIAGMETAAICQDVGYLPQDPNALLFAETVAEEMRITLHNHGLDPASLAIGPDALLDRLHIASKAGAYPRDLSAGERQRAALAAIMITHPRALLLDEPTRGLDYRSKQGLVDLLRAWRDEGLAILVVTHDVELAAAVSDRVLLMRGGTIVARGRPAQLLRHATPFTPQIAEVFPETDWLTADDALTGLRSQRPRRDLTDPNL